MTITLNGSTGINTPGVVNTAAETIATTLAVTGVTTIAAGSAAAPSLVGTTGGATTGVWFPAASTVAFANGGVESARIDSNRNFTVGSAVANTNRAITINGVANKSGLIQFQESGADKWLIGNGAASENGVFEVYSATTGTGVQLARNATSWAAGSDERIKDIIEPITDAVTKVATLRAVIGKYKTDASNTRRSFLIAQDVQAVLPEAVDDTNPEKLGVRYTEVIPLLVAAIKEQQALITSLTARITALENK
jgi:hypothetical protein